METKRNRRRGSALIMVLGILSVLLLMAVAFSSFVRTERSGSTNLKNAVVARNSLYTAVGRVMDTVVAGFLSDDHRGGCLAALFAYRAVVRYRCGFAVFYFDQQAFCCRILHYNVDSLILLAVTLRINNQQINEKSLIL